MLNRLLPVALLAALTATLLPHSPGVAAAERAVVEVDAGGRGGTDKGYVGGRTVRTRQSIGGTESQTAFSSVRVGPQAYRLPVPSPGTYTVQLGFVELTHRAAGKRRFSVDAEGQRVVSDLDIFATAGRHQAVTRTGAVPVTDGSLDLTFPATAGNAAVASITVLGPLPAPGGQPPAPTPAPARPAPAPGPATASVECGYGTFSGDRAPGACWRPYADSSPFNRPLPASPRVLGNSAPMVRKVLSGGPIPDLVAGVADTDEDWYHPLYYAAPSDPLYTVTCTEDWGRCAVEGLQVRIPAAARPAGGSDGHLTVIDQASGWEYDLWQVQDKPTGGGRLVVSWGGRTQIKGDGLGSDATAAHFGLAAGIIRAQELEAGRIDHALFMVVNCTDRSFVYPAQGLAATCRNTTDAPPDGQRFWLAMSDAEIDALPAPAWKKTILRALAHYGAFVGDTGGNEAFGLQFESGSSYTSFGRPDPMVAFAAKQTAGVSRWEGRYYFDLASGVDWAGRLRAVDPCVSRGTC